MKRRLTAAALAACLLLPGVVRAGTEKGERVACTVRAMLASPKKGAVDRRLAFLKKQLARPPFSAYRSFTLLADAKIDLPRAAPRTTHLPTGKVLRLTFKERLLGRKDRVRLRMHLAITPPKVRRFLPGTVFSIADGGTLLVAGEPFRGGTLVVGITCRAR